MAVTAGAAMSGTPREIQCELSDSPIRCLTSVDGPCRKFCKAGRTMQLKDISILYFVRNVGGDIRLHTYAHIPALHSCIHIK